MRRISTGLAALLAVISLSAAPAMATTAKHKTHAPKVTCTQIKDAMASGKSADDVAKGLKVSAERIKACTAPAAKHESHHPAKGS